MPVALIVTGLIATLPPSSDPRPYTLFNPTPRDRLRPMSTDRPDATESPHTVDAGRVQIELSFADYSYDRSGSSTTRVLAAAPMLLKLGVLENVDLQLGIDPYVRSELEPSGSAGRVVHDGFGDLVTRVKINLWGNGSVDRPGDTAMAIMPFLKFPTAADGLGNDHLEGGLIIPMALACPGDWSLGLMAQLDFVRSEDDDRSVLDFVHTATASRTIAGDLGGFVEFAGAQDLSGEEGYRGQVNLGLTYAVSADIQLDCGVRIGVTREAEDVGVFLGLSIRH